MSNRITVIQGVDKTVTVDILDENNQPMASERLEGAVATFLLREEAADVVNVLSFNSTDMPTRVSVSVQNATVFLAILTADSVGLALQSYVYQLELKLADVDVDDIDLIPWAPLSVVLGGSAAPPPPVFDNTVKLDHDFMFPGDLAYYTPGGTPIAGAQIRVYYKTQYDVGNLTAPVGLTSTDAAGKWVQPVFVVPGFSYSIRYELPNEFGPDVREVIGV